MNMLSKIGLRQTMTIVAPKPYIGQIGPLRKPLFTNFPVLQAAKETSTHHPKNEYIVNIQIIS